MSGEQFALPEAVERLREVRRTPPTDALIVISAADPLNLAGIVTAGERVRAVAATRIVYRDGVPLAALEGDYIRPLADDRPADRGRCRQRAGRPARAGGDQRFRRPRLLRALRALRGRRWRPTRFARRGGRSLRIRRTALRFRLRQSYARQVAREDAMMRPLH